MSNSFHVSQVSRGQAYAILGGAALMMTLAMGIRQNLGLFQAPASKELGIAISDFALAISVQQVAWGLSQPFAGIVADKHGTTRGGAGRQPAVHRRRRADGDRTGRAADRAGRRRADRRGARLHDLGHHRQHRRPRRAADAADAGLRHRLGGGLGRHHADRADRGLHAEPRRLARRPVGLRHPRRRHAARRLDRQPRRQAAQQRRRPTATSA